MTYLDEVLNPSELSEMINQGYVQVRHHPDYPYVIFCYTKQAMFERKWNHTTMTCRGLIVNEDTSEVLARPFKKFFNVGEPDAPTVQHGDWVTVYDKLDGSLGIAYETPDGPAIATKGSFVSDQATKGTELLRAKYPLYFHDDINTDMFEIIYPENRIVLDYGELEELRYLGSVNIEDGEDYWNGILMNYYQVPVNHFLFSGEWCHIQGDFNMGRPNREGYVIHNEEKGYRLKMKQQDYLELHKVMTGLNERQLWDWLSQGRLINGILADLPEELHGWAKPVLEDLVDQYLRIKGDVVRAFVYLKKESADRKEFALRIKERPALHKGVLFCMLDGQHDRADDLIWKAVRP
jgi:RNA ligase